MLTEAQLEQAGRCFSFLNGEDLELRRWMTESASVAQLPRGQHVCMQGSSCAHLALVLEGTARVYKLGESGKEITLYRVDSGQSCILTASCILNNLPFPAFAVCETEVTALVIPAAKVQTWMAESATWRDYIFGLIAQRLSDVIDVIDEVVFRRMDRRIASYLLKHDNAESGEIRVTHQEIAADLGTSREVVSRILKDFEMKALLKVHRGTITLTDRPGIRLKTEE